MWQRDKPSTSGGTSDFRTIPAGIRYPNPGAYSVSLLASTPPLKASTSWGSKTGKNPLRLAGYILVGPVTGTTINVERFTPGGMKAGNAMAYEGWTFRDLTRQGIDWQVRNTGVSACSVDEGPMPSTTGSTGYLVMPAVEYNCLDGILQDHPVDAWAQSPAYDCSGFDVIIYRFQQRFLVNGTPPLMECQVSNDGGFNWKSYDLLGDRSVGTPWGNPVETVELNLTEYAAHRSDVRIRFYWQGSSGYYWMIDDAELIGMNICGGMTASINGLDKVYKGYQPSSTSRLVAGATGGVPPYSYEWSTGETTQSVTFSPVETTEYGVTVYDAGGCPATASFVVEVVDVRCGSKLDKVLMCTRALGKKIPPFTICVAPAAVPAMLRTGASLGACPYDPCKGFQASVTGRDVVYLGYPPLGYTTLMALPAGGTAPFTWLWSTGATTHTIQVSPDVTSTYSVTITDALGCISEASFTVRVEDIRCSPGGIWMCRKIIGKKTTWLTACVPVQNVAAELKRGSSLGRCQKSGFMDDLDTTGPIEPEMTVFPNPSDGRINLELNGMPDGAVLVEVRDILGRMVQQELVAVSGGQLSRTIDIPQNGHYLITARTGTCVLTRRVSVIR